MLFQSTTAINIGLFPICEVEILQEIVNIIESFYYHFRWVSKDFWLKVLKCWYLGFLLIFVKRDKHLTNITIVFKMMYWTIAF